MNRLGRMDAVIHNAGVYTGPQVVPVNLVAPYLLTALVHRPQRLVYLSSSEHRSGRPSLTSIDWSGRHGNGSYPDSKLFLTTLALAVARLWVVLQVRASADAAGRRARRGSRWVRGVSGADGDTEEPVQDDDEGEEPEEGAE